MSKIEELYACYEALKCEEAPETMSEGDNMAATERYRTLLSAARGSVSERLLTAQLIPVFFHRFEELWEESFELYLSLVEDEEGKVRREAIKGLLLFFNGKPSQFSSRFGDALCQMLRATEDLSELGQVKRTLTTLLLLQPQPALQGIFHQVRHGDPETREVGLRFLVEKSKRLVKAWDRETQAHFVTLIQTVLSDQDCSTEEIKVLFGLLLLTSLGKCTSGRRKLVSIFGQVLEGEVALLLDGDQHSVQRCLAYGRSALSLVQICPELDLNEMFTSLGSRLLPACCTTGSSGPALVGGLKLLAELAAGTNTSLDGAATAGLALKSLVSDVLLCLPSSGHPALLTEDAGDRLPETELTGLEALLTVLRSSLKACSRGYLAESGCLPELRRRLLWLARLCGAYSRLLESSTPGAPQPGAPDKAVALACLANIIRLVKELSESPPRTRGWLGLSWRAPLPGSPGTPAGGEGRQSKRRRHSL